MSIDDVTVSPEVVEKWLDTNADWLADYLARRRPNQSQISLSSSVGQLRGVSGSGGNSLASPVDPAVANRQHQLTNTSAVGSATARARCWSRGSTGSTWTSTRTTENGGAAGSSPKLSPNLIMLQSGGSCGSADGGGDDLDPPRSGQMFFPVVSPSPSTSSLPPSSSSAPTIFNYRHQRSDSKKRLRHDFVRARSAARKTGSTAGAADGQRHQQANCHNTNGGGLSSSTESTPSHQQELSFASFDGFAYLSNNISPSVQLGPLYACERPHNRTC